MLRDSSYRSSIAGFFGASLFSMLVSCHVQNPNIEIPAILPDQPVSIIVELDPVECDTPAISYNDLSSLATHFLLSHEWKNAYSVISRFGDVPVPSEDADFFLWCLEFSSFKWRGSGDSYRIGDHALNFVKKMNPESLRSDKNALERCTILLDALTDVFPMNYAYHADLGKCYAMNSDFSRASIEYVRAIDLWPTDDQGLYTPLVQAYISDSKIHSILSVEELLDCSSPSFVMPKLLDHVDEILWSGVSITHNSSAVEVSRGFAELFDALGSRMLDRGITSKALQYFCMSASNRFVLGDVPGNVREYLRGRYDEVNVVLHGELRPLADVYKNSMDGRIRIPREKEFWRLLKE